TSGVTGAVSASNRLVGTTALDYVGNSGVYALSNGNYVVGSALWDNGAATNAGAVTWCNGSSGTTGAVSASNSLVGSTTNDQVGNPGVTALSNGNYVVRSGNWDNGAATDAGAVTWGSGTSGVTGAVSASNSLVGSTAYDRVGNNGVTALSNGNYVVRSASWDNGAATDAGAVTWGNGSSGTTGAVSASNSLVGSTASDVVGNSGIFALSDGNYVVWSSSWDNGATVNARAQTLGDGARGVSGPVSAANSLVGNGTASSFVAPAFLTHGFVGGYQGYRISVAYPLEYTTFKRATGRTITSPTARIAQLLSEGIDVTLQASQDLTLKSPILVNNPSGAGGHLTLIAGRSVILQANVTTDDGDLTLISNATLADGVVDADRGAGNASVQNTATIAAGTGTVRFETRDGAGLTNKTRADYGLGAVTAGTTVVVPFSDSMTPTSATPADTVTIVGGGLSGATVKVGGVSATLVSVASNQVQLKVGAATPTGSQSVVLTTASGSITVGNLTVSGTDPTPPTGGTVNDGAGADVDLQASATAIQANWSGFADPETGVASYQWAIGTTAGGTQVQAFTSVGTGTTGSATGLTLVSGTTYYVTVRAFNGAGGSTDVSSDGVKVDTSAPTAGTVNDGAGADVDFQTSASAIQANWTGFADAESGIASYQWAIGTTAGGTQVQAFTSVGTGTTGSATGLTLVSGTTYYVTVRATNGVGLTTDVTSDGVKVDTSAPTAGTVNDGAGADVDFQTSTTAIQANWSGFADAETGVTDYAWAIGTTAGGTQVQTFTSVGTGTTGSATGLTLTSGTTYYVTVRATNGAGLTTLVTSDGVKVDTSAPTAGTVSDGSGADVDFQTSTSAIQANWTGFADAESGITSYQWAIGTTAGGTQVQGFTSVGTGTTGSATGLTLTSGTTYYVTVRATNGAAQS
ncbi:MAG: hypothetical protein AB7P37_23495, partial [Ramlibacter sp.]